MISEDLKGSFHMFATTFGKMTKLLIPCFGTHFTYIFYVRLVIAICRFVYFIVSADILLCCNVQNIYFHT